MSDPPRTQVQPADLGLGALFHLTRDVVLLVDLPTNRLVLLNPAAEAFLGYTSEQAAGLPMERLVPLVERPGLHALIQQLLRRPSVPTVECRILDAAGSERWVELSALAIQGVDSIAMLVCHDVTERRLAEERRREQARAEGMLRTIDTLGQALHHHLTVAGGHLARAAADRHTRRDVRAALEHAQRALAHATSTLSQLRRVGQLGEMELAVEAVEASSSGAPEGPAVETQAEPNSATTN